jgi:hypothetical protein
MGNEREINAWPYHYPPNLLYIFAISLTNGILAKERMMQKEP